MVDLRWSSREEITLIKIVQCKEIHDMSELVNRRPSAETPQIFRKDDQIIEIGKCAS